MSDQQIRTSAEGSVGFTWQPMVYVAHPLTSGWSSDPRAVTENCALAWREAHRVLDAALHRVALWVPAALLHLHEWDALEYVREWRDVDDGTYMRIGMAALAHCDGAVFVLGWEDSDGCLVELSFCESHGIPWLDANSASGREVGEWVSSLAQRRIG